MKWDKRFRYLVIVSSVFLCGVAFAFTLHRLYWAFVFTILAIFPLWDIAVDLYRKRRDKSQ